MNSSKTFLALAITVVAAIPASALTDGPYISSISLTTTGWNLNLSIPKFNPGLGTLNSISYTLNGSTAGTAKYESLDGAPASISLTLSASLTLQRPDLSTIKIIIPSTTVNESSAASDGVIDFLGASGSTFSGLSGSTTSGALSLSGAGDRALFTGAGSIILPVVAAGSSSGSGSGNLVTQFNTAAAADISVTYNYNKDTGVPEPRVYGAIGAVACLGLLGYRRIRSRQAAQA